MTAAETITHVIALCENPHWNAVSKQRIANMVRSIELEIVENERIVNSVSAMLGWSNPPPLGTIEMELNILKRKAKAYDEGKRIP